MSNKIQYDISERVVDETTSRRKWLARARQEGYEKDMLLLFAKYDRLIRLATSDKERADIAKLGVLEVYKLMGSGGKLYVDGQLVYNDDNFESLRNVMSNENKKFMGDVDWFNPKKGFGFIKWNKDGVQQKDMFVHFSDIQCEGFKTLYAGQKVSFEVGANYDGDPKAINVEILKN